VLPTDLVWYWNAARYLLSSGIKSATFDVTRTCSWCFLITLKHVWATVPSSYCVRFEGKMCNFEFTLLNTWISACSQVSLTQFLIFPPTNFVDLQKVCPNSHGP